MCKWLCILKKLCFCSAWMRLHDVKPSKPQRTFENLIPVSLFPFLKSDCKLATRLLLNDSPRSDVCTVNHVRFHTDRRWVHTDTIWAFGTVQGGAGYARLGQEVSSVHPSPWLLSPALQPVGCHVVVAAMGHFWAPWFSVWRAAFVVCSPSLASPKALGIGRLLFLLA